MLCRNWAQKRLAMVQSAREVSHDGSHDLTVSPVDNTVARGKANYDCGHQLKGDCKMNPQFKVKPTEFDGWVFMSGLTLGALLTLILSTMLR